MTLELRPYCGGDEAEAVAIHRSMLPEFHFLLFWNEAMSWSEFLALIDAQRRGVNLAPSSQHWVRADQLAAVVDGLIVGRVSIRFELDEFLSERGGHIGYGVAPTQRNQGFASEILRLALEILRAQGVGRILVTCDDANLASARVIEKNGGVFESYATPVPEDEVLVRRYWIE
ncbi:MAG TPA: GNAT family N-acetyltransferase [Acidimicrobiales bacterium]|jgi:predicted acetyltransferase